jgi:NIPSNAP protein
MKILRSRWFAVCAAVLLMAAAAGLMARLVQVREVRAASDRVFELRIYHAVAGKLPVMETRFREKTSKILARHNLNVIGYWVTTEGPESSFVFLLAHESREAAKKNWDAFRADPEFREVAAAEQAEKTLEKADVMYLRPTDFSPMK